MGVLLHFCCTLNDIIESWQRKVPENIGKDGADYGKQYVKL